MVLIRIDIYTSIRVFFNCYFFMFTIKAVVHDAQNKRNTPHNYGKQNITSWLFTCLAKIVTRYMYFTSFEVNTWDRQSVLFHFNSFWSYHIFCSTACPCPIPVCFVTMFAGTINLKGTGGTHNTLQVYRGMCSCWNYVTRTHGDIDFSYYGLGFWFKGHQRSIIANVFGN